MEEFDEFLTPKVPCLADFPTTEDYSTVSFDDRFPEIVATPIPGGQQQLLLQLQLSLEPRQLIPPYDNETTKKKLTRRQWRMRKAFSSRTDELVRADLYKMMHHLPTQCQPHRQHLARQTRRTMWNNSLTSIFRSGEAISNYAQCRTNNVNRTVLPTYFSESGFSQPVSTLINVEQQPALRPKRKTQIPSITTTLCFETEAMLKVANEYLQLSEESPKNGTDHVVRQFIQSCVSQMAPVFPKRKEVLSVTLPSPIMELKNVTLSSTGNSLKKASSFGFVNILKTATKTLDRVPDKDIHSTFTSMKWADDLGIPVNDVKQLNKLLQLEIYTDKTPEKTPAHEIRVNFSKAELPGRCDIAPIMLKRPTTNLKRQKMVKINDLPTRIISPRSHKLMSSMFRKIKAKKKTRVMLSFAQECFTREKERPRMTTSIIDKHLEKKKAVFKEMLMKLRCREDIYTYPPHILNFIAERELNLLYDNIDIIRRGKEIQSATIWCQAERLRGLTPESNEREKHAYWRTSSRAIYRYNEFTIVDDPEMTKPILPPIQNKFNDNQFNEPGHFRNDGDRGASYNQVPTHDSHMQNDDDLIEMSMNEDSSELVETLRKRDYHRIRHNNDNTQKEIKNIEAKTPGTSARGHGSNGLDDMRCSTWSKNMASHCLSLNPLRTILLSPPMISILPTLISLTQSHLNNGIDHRVAIICDGDRDDFDHVHSYFRRHMKNISVSTVCSNIAEYDLDDGINALEVTSKIVIVDRLSTRLAFTYSLLLILLSLPSLMGSRALRRPEQRLRIQDAARWKRIKSAVIAPLNIWTGIERFVARAAMYAGKLGISKVLYNASMSDIRILKKGFIRALFERPPYDAISMAEAFEDDARGLLKSYNNVERTKRWATVSTFVDTIEAASRLDEVSVMFLRDYMSQLEDWDETATEMAQLFNIKQAQLYALHDGVETAKEYLEETMKKHPSRKALFDRLIRTIRRRCPNLFEERQEIGSDDVPQYWMEEVLKRAFVESFNMMRNNGAEQTNETSTRKYRPFKALVITDTTETREKLRQVDFTLHFEGMAWYPPVVLKWDEMQLEQMLSEYGFDLEEISHIFHVTDGRSDAVPDYKLTNDMLESVFGWHTHLVTIYVNPSGDLKKAWEDNINRYFKLGEQIDSNSTSPTAEEESCTAAVQHTNVATLCKWIKQETFIDDRDEIHFNQRLRQRQVIAPAGSTQNTLIGRKRPRTGDEDDDKPLVEALQEDREDESQEPRRHITRIIKPPLQNGMTSHKGSTWTKHLGEILQTSRMGRLNRSGNGIQMEIYKPRNRSVRLSARKIIEYGLNGMRLQLTEELNRFDSARDQDDFEDNARDQMTVEITTAEETENMHAGQKSVAQFILNEAIQGDNKLQRRCRVAT